MGYSNWSNVAYSKLRKGRKGASTKKIFKNTKVDPQMNPKGFDVRESRDSAAHPSSNAIIVAFDVTGSMGHIPDRFAREKLGGLMRMLVEREYIEDPQVLFAAVGDATCDRGPLQVGQFESGLEMDMWLTRMWLEGGGGGQKSESYGLAHYFAAKHTSVDCWEKREKKGYLFTMGDEMSWDVTADHIAKVFGYDPERDFTMAELVELAQERYEVFHIQVAEAHHGKDPEVIGFWRDLLGERALILDDADGVCELIGTTIGLVEDRLDLDTVDRDLVDQGVDAGTAAAVSASLAPLAGSDLLVRKAKGALPATTAAMRGIERL